MDILQATLPQTQLANWKLNMLKTPNYEAKCFVSITIQWSNFQLECQMKAFQNWGENHQFYTLFLQIIFRRNEEKLSTVTYQ